MIPGSWEKNEIEQIEYQSLKSLFNLPQKTPTVAIVHTFGTLYTKIRIDKKQLQYLHRILQREENHWTNKALKTLQCRNIGWYKKIMTTLEAYNLENDFDEIRRIPTAIWRNKVATATEIKNKERILKECPKSKMANQFQRQKQQA